MSTEVSIIDEEGGISRVRDDTDTTNWALYGHPDDNPNELCYMGSGSEGVEELVDSLMDSKMQYALVRVEETIDMSATIKFMYVRWSGTNVPFVKRGKYGVVHGSIEKYFTPYHCSIEADSRDELTLDVVMTKLQEQSGTKSKVLEATVAKTRPERGFTSGTTTKMDSTGATPTQASHVNKVGKMGSSFTGMTGMAKSSGGVRADDEVIKALQAFRDDAEAVWCAINYEDNNPKNGKLVVMGVGQDMEELTALCTPEMLLYALIRVKDVVDGIDTVKFAYVQFVGESVKPMAKAKVSTHKGALEKQFKPFHVSIYATLSPEVSLRVIKEKVGSASGSKSNIKT